MEIRPPIRPATLHRQAAVGLGGLMQIYNDEVDACARVEKSALASRQVTFT
jgi:hypothetical protein